MPPKRKASAKAAAVAPAPAEEEDWTTFTVAQLKEELKARNLDTTGKKDVLIQRLEESAGDRDDEAASTASPKKRKGKGDTKAAESDMQKAIKKLKASDKSGPGKTCKIDGYVLSSHAGTHAQVHEDYSFMLNQTNIGHNNNKFYVGQILERNDGRYDVFTKWGRVGEPGQHNFSVHSDIGQAVAEFEKKFSDKTGNKWDKRDDFQPKKGKYTLIETEGDDEEDVDGTVEVDSTTKLVGNPKAKSLLYAVTQELVQLIFDHDMFNDAMKKLNLDTKKMPLGKLSKSQIAKGFEALEIIEAAIKDENGEDLSELSSRFYTVIPHDFQRTRPPVIDSLETVQEKFDMLITLGDIEIAQAMQKSQKSEDEKHPYDIKYELLKCKLSLVNQSSPDFKVVNKYFESTKSKGSRMKLKNVWVVDRDLEDSRFSAHKDIKHRKLLWHGTNVAVVAAILKTGLRIMPHSGGRVGRGIYFASENGKSAGYTSPARNVGLMFLNEVALGNEKDITVDDSGLKAAPPGFDSVVARGQFEPEPRLDTKIKLGGKEVIVPQGEPVKQSKYGSSNFSQSEYLVYRESQVRIRYLLSFDWY